jgi:hypothetical protein
VLGPGFGLFSTLDSGTNAKAARAAYKILTEQYPNWRWLVFLADCKIGSGESQPPSEMLDTHHVAFRHFNARSGFHTAKTYYLFRSKQQLQGSSRLNALKKDLDKINQNV